MWYGSAGKVKEKKTTLFGAFDHVISYKLYELRQPGEKNDLTLKVKQ